MRMVGAASGISIRAPNDAYFSYFNSPYIGHSLGTAIDIYPRHQEWGGPVLSPVSGKIVKIRKLLMGRMKPFPTDDFDYGIAILPENSRNHIVRVMHCKPTLKVGDRIDLGDQIGSAIRSRYFNYWTGPHYHVEIMPFESFSRSTKSFLLDIPVGKIKDQTGKALSRMELLITDVSDDCAIGYLKEKSYISIGNISGLSACAQGGSVLGIIDGGLSHYQHGGVLGDHLSMVNDTVYFGDSPVGSVTSRRGGVSCFQRGPSIVPFLNGLELRGLSCFLYPYQLTKNGIPQIILIPREYRGFTGLIESDSVGVLEIKSCSNTDKF